MKGRVALSPVVVVVVIMAVMGFYLVITYNGFVKSEEERDGDQKINRNR